MRFILALLVLVALFLVVRADIWTNCGKDSDHLHISEVIINPNPPKRGQPLTVNATGTLDETVTGGIVAMTVYMGAIKVLDKKVDICSIDKTVPCPIPSGDYKIGVSETVPNSLPRAEYKGKVIATDQNKDEIACISFDFRLQ